MDSISSQENLVTTINEFYIYTNPKSECGHSEGQIFHDVEYSTEVFNRLEYNLLVVLEQMTYKYKIKQPELIYMGNKGVYQALNLSNYVTALCLKIPRCLDFLFIGTQNHLNVYWLNKMYRMLCQTLPELYTDSKLIDEHNFRSSSDLYNKFLAFKLKASSQKFWSVRVDYEEKSATFISTLLSILDIVDNK